MAGVGRRVKVRVLESESKLWAESWPADLPTIRIYFSWHTHTHISFEFSVLIE